MAVKTYLVFFFFQFSQCSTIFTGWMPTILRAGRGMTLWENARPDAPPEKLELFSYENNPVQQYICITCVDWTVSLYGDACYFPCLLYKHILCGGAVVQHICAIASNGKPAIFDILILGCGVGCNVGMCLKISFLSL